MKVMIREVWIERTSQLEASLLSSVWGLEKEPSKGQDEVDLTKVNLFLFGAF